MRVREFFLRRPTLAVLATFFMVGRTLTGLPPPPLFVADQVHEARFEAVYRLYPLPGAQGDPAVPAEEASIVFYPFDPEDADARAEAPGIRPGEVVVEVFAYEAGRARHRALLASVAGSRRWRVIDPARDATDG